MPLRCKDPASTNFPKHHKEIMKSKVTIISILTAVFITATGFAQPTLTQSWTVAGGAWTKANQPDWTWTDDPSPLYSDEGNDSGAVLYVTDMATIVDSRGSPTSENSGLLTSFFYTKGSAPSFLLQATSILSGLETITFTIDYADISVTAIESINLSLDFSSAYTGLAADATVVGSYTANGFDWTTWSYTWDVSDLGPTTDFSINWGALDPHSAFAGLQLTQIGAAIPEPATYTILCALAIIAASALRKRGRKA